MRKQLALRNAVNAIEQAEDDADVSGLYAFCASQGLSEDAVNGLVEMNGPTDLGRVCQLVPVEEDEVEVEEIVIEDVVEEDDESDET